MSKNLKDQISKVFLLVTSLAASEGNKETKKKSLGITKLQ